MFTKSSTTIPHNPGNGKYRIFSSSYFVLFLCLRRQLNCTVSPIDTDRLKFCLPVGEYTQVIGILRVMKVAYLVLRNRCSTNCPALGFARAGSRPVHLIAMAGSYASIMLLTLLFQRLMEIFYCACFFRFRHLCCICADFIIVSDFRESVNEEILLQSLTG